MVTASYSKGIFVLFCFFPFFQTGLVDCQTCGNETNNDENLFLIANISHCHNDAKSRKLKVKYCRIFACNMIHSLKLAQTDAFQLYARESVFSLRKAQFFFEDFRSLPFRG